MKGFAMLFWSLFILMVIAVSIWLYLIFSNILLQDFIPQMEIYINETESNNTEVDAIITATKTSWINWILVLFAGLIAVLALIATKKENIQDYG